MLWLLALLASLWLPPACDTGFCSCRGPATAADALQSADAVFTGRAISVRDTIVLGDSLVPEWPRRVATLLADGAWKGVEAQTVTVTTGMGGGDCGFPFAQGETYLVYAHRGGRDGSGPLETSICGRTVLLARADGDLQALGAPRRTWPARPRIEPARRERR
jgi:hypothetical protein